MLIKQVLQKAEAAISEGGFKEAALEAAILLRHTLKLSPTELHLQLDKELPPEQIALFESHISRRLDHEPIAYITGHKEFFGVEFYVNKFCLIPRPETEILVEKAIEIASKIPSPKIVDVGTGSGVIAIALAKYLTQAEIYAVDISTEALKIADSNRRRHNVSGSVRLIQSDLLAQIENPVNLIVANLPYITDSEMNHLSREITQFEPQQALRSGPNGLDHIGRLLSQSQNKIAQNGSILLEIGYDQAAKVIDLAGKYFPRASVNVLPDLAGTDRVIHIQT